MSQKYNLFISHSWAYTDAYEKLIGLLDKGEDFSYKNYSVPKDDPIHNANNDKELYEAIKRQMSSSHVVIILAGVYSTYSKWINKEIKIAKEGFSKPKKIIAIEPWDSERTSKVVKDNADIIVKWKSKSLIKAIKDYS
ncbi:TIR domain-containing protein [Bacillus sp. (in: firmicutes)]|uniref:TIR domain-containing protein n=1 Tax=Bacillus sp. TaxID=1409 RepID=UPI0029033720|nr:TIR domain-containing protein [Bacillus sp. (in: firmicutes)]MDU2391254.1 TIR domain-containing protein [Bacillus sp. (in: firmicutes)]